MTNEQKIDEIMVQAANLGRAEVEHYNMPSSLRAGVCERKGAALRHAITAALAAKDAENAELLAEVQKCSQIALRLDAMHPDAPGSFTGTPSERISWAIERLNADMRTAMAAVEAEAAAMSDALKRIAEAMGLGIGHTAEEIVAAVAALQAIKVNPEPGEWIEWKGGECPIANGVRHQIKMRDGYLSSDDLEAWSWIGWGHTAEENDIVAYRVLP